MLLASLGLTVLGVDVAETAIALARERAAERKLTAEFAFGDAFDLAQFAREFASVLDCGLFHSFDRDERRRYVASLATVTKLGGTLHVLCFSDAAPDAGPHPVSERDLREAFDTGSGWSVISIVADRVRTRFHDEHGAPAWLATIERTAP